MAYLPEEKGWGPGVFQIELDTPWVGGPEGNCNKQALEIIRRLNWLKDYAGEVEAARGGGMRSWGTGWIISRALTWGISRPSGCIPGRRLSPIAG